MPSTFEHTGASSSLTQRRPAANNLPNFELPAPFGQQLQQKYNLPQLNALPQTTTMGGGNLLTPPSTVPGDNISPLTALLHGANSNQGVSNYNYGWPPLQTGLTPVMGSASGNTPQPWGPGLNSVRGLFSPPLPGRGESNSPTAAESLPPPPPYDLSPLPPLPTSMSMGAPSSLPAIAANQMQAFMAQTQTQTQTPISATTTQPSPINGTDAYTQRPQSTPTFYSQSQPSTAQQSTFSPFNSQSSPIQQQSPMSAPPPGSRISPMSTIPATFSPPVSQANAFNRSSYAPYLPALSAPPQMNGPIMSNMHNPSHPMGLMAMQGHGLPAGYPYHSGTAAHMQQQLYGAPQSTPHNERPFKCDQCPQSFNRNHDLKRHKRIHLAVKPFPCGHCEKSFSRKDALKVRVLSSPSEIRR